MYKVSSNPITRKSQDMIMFALFGLTKERAYADISITEICERADVVRKTFYRNFESKDDVISYALDTFIMEFIRGSEETNVFAFLIDFYEMLLEQREYLSVVLKQDLLYFVRRKIIALLESVDIKINTRVEIDAAKYRYVYDYIASTIISIVQTWYETGFVETPAELASLTEMLITGRAFEGSDYLVFLQ